MSRYRRGRLSPLIGDARHRVRQALTALHASGADGACPGGVACPGGAASLGSAERGGQPPRILVACSGGPDSLALAAVAAFFGRRGDYRVGAVVVDHSLQQGSSEVAARASAQLVGLGLDPVTVRTVAVNSRGFGPEAAARTARYGALAAAAEQYQACAVLLGHTLDDQAEQVLLGLSRGSGTRSLAGMPERRGRYLRPFLGLRRQDTLNICAEEGLEPWHDPTNQDPRYARSRVRSEVLPLLEEKLGPGIAEALHRSAQILAQDADYLDSVAAEHYESMVAREQRRLRLDEDGLRSLPPALRQRVMSLAVAELSGTNPAFERLRAAEALLRRSGSAGPVEVGGHVSVYRELRSKRRPDSVPQGGRGCGSLVFIKNI